MGENLTSDRAAGRESRQTYRHGMALALQENRESGNMRVPTASLIDKLDPDANIRQALDIDSFDHLNLLIGLHEELGVEIPEGDNGQLTTLTDIIGYLSARVH